MKAADYVETPTSVTKITLGYRVRCTAAGCRNLGRMILRHAGAGGRPIDISVFCVAHGRSRVNATERSFHEAKKLAAKQETKLWELRSATSLAQSLRNTGQIDEAHVMLAEIYSWFTEGFNTPDLIDAKKLLDELIG
jgi:hypothetical protein